MTGRNENRKRKMEKKSGAGNGARTRGINLGKVALYQLSYSRAEKGVGAGAGNGARTRGINLGKVALYQLSYSRNATVRIIRISSRIARAFCDLRCFCRETTPGARDLLDHGLPEDGGCRIRGGRSSGGRRPAPPRIPGYRSGPHGAFPWGTRFPGPSGSPAP